MWVVADVDMKSENDVDSLFLCFFTILNPPLRLSVITSGALNEKLALLLGQSPEIIEKMMREKQVAIGQIRKGGQPFGELIGILSFGHNLERNSGTFMMTMPGMGPNGENVSCILGYGLDWQFFNYDGSRIPLTDSL